jgi:hypothetical protein
MIRKEGQSHDQIFNDVTAKKKMQRALPHNPLEP